MDLVASSLHVILQVGIKINQIVQTLKSNGTQCHILSERVQIIAILVKKLQETKRFIYCPELVKLKFA